MEDVIEFVLQAICNACRYLLILGCLLNPLYAATQGSVGQSSSHGSVSISLTIPESAQLIVQSPKQANHNNQICLQVIDSFSSSNGFYNIAGLDGALSAIYDAATGNYEKSISQIHLNHNNSNDSGDVCGFTKAIETKTSAHSSAMLLILIAE